MRWAAILVLLALGGTAHADADFAWPKRLRGIYTGGAAYSIGELSGGGPAITMDYSLGRKRWMFGIEGQAQWVAIAGFSTRAGGVMRWLARSLHPDGSAAIELYFDVDPGINVIEKDGVTIVRPDLRVGWGWQIRDTGKWRIRLALRAIIAPRADVDRMVACKGDCPETRVFPFDDGYEALVGVAW